MGQVLIPGADITLQLNRMSNSDLQRLMKQVGQELSIREVEVPVKVSSATSLPVYIYLKDFDPTHTGHAYVAGLYIDAKTDNPKRYFFAPKKKSETEEGKFEYVWHFEIKKNSAVFEMRLNDIEGQDREWWIYENNVFSKVSKKIAFGKLRHFHNKNLD